MSPLPIDQAMEIALQRHQAGRLAEAETLYRQVLARQPNHFQALHLLGVLAGQAGGTQIAAELIQRAIAVNPHDAEARHNLANVLQAAGRLEEAITAYREALRLEPRRASAWNNLGSALQARGRHEEAIAAFRQAIAFEPGFSAFHTNLGNALQTAGQFEEAIAACREAVRLDSDNAAARNNLGLSLQGAVQLVEAVQAHQEAVRLAPVEANFHYNLGNALRATGQIEQAITAYGEVLRLSPSHAEAQNNCGIALQEAGRLDEAIGCYSQAIHLQPHSAQAWSNLGHALQASGRFDEAIAPCREALRLDPNHAEAANNLGTALQAKGQLDEAIAAYRRAVQIRPDFADALINMGNALQASGKLDEAIEVCRGALRINPGHPKTFETIGNCFQARGQLGEAIAAYRETLRLKPDFPDALRNLGNALLSAGKPDEAMEVCRDALRIDPDHPKALEIMGNCFKNQAEMDLAVECYRKAMALQPGAAEIHSNLIFALYCHPDYDAAAILAESREWDCRHAQPLSRFIRAHENDPSPERPLRVGYVSSDFREHVVGWNFLPLLAEHDRKRFEIFCYADVLAPDAMTAQFRAQCGHWRNLAGRSDEQVAEGIRGDRIDILVDLALHTAGNRLPLFARKPAPVQVAYLGCAGTTGLDAIDYRLSDPFLDPPETDLSCYAEETVRLPHCYWCYEPGGPAPAASTLPALSAGRVTFGCLNKLAKISNEALNLWAEILQMVPHSGLLLHAPAGSCRDRVLDRLAEEGIPRDRTDFVGGLPLEQYFQAWQRIDVALDSFPYAGGITTCDALWMGVPVVSLSGRTAVGRGGCSILHNIGLPELVAETSRRYVEIAVALANDLPRLSQLRSGLRERMERSALRDPRGFARDIEAAYREMWRIWCQGRRAQE